MKKALLIVPAALALAGCVNSSTNFSNRGVTYQVTPELNGEKAYVAGSPTSSDAVVNAEKTFETAAKTNVAQALTDTSVNDQSKTEAQPKAAKAETKAQPKETKAETKEQPKGAEAK